MASMADSFSQFKPWLCGYHKMIVTGSSGRFFDLITMVLPKIMLFLDFFLIFQKNLRFNFYFILF